LLLVAAVAEVTVAEVGVQAVYLLDMQGLLLALLTPLLLVLAALVVMAHRL
jgi:hypothetical protein